MPYPKPLLKVVVTYKLVEEYGYEVVISLVNFFDMKEDFSRDVAKKKLYEA